MDNVMDQDAAVQLTRMEGKLDRMYDNVGRALTDVADLKARVTALENINNQIRGAATAMKTVYALGGAGGGAAVVALLIKVLGG